MCGITGIFAFNEIGRMQLIHLENATRALHKRGPDHHDTYLAENVGLGHRRLSIIDTSSASNQPIQDVTGRYTLIFNGEIYNYKSLKKQLVNKGYQFKSEGDTEVLLYLLIDQGTECLEKLNGFFAFAFHDLEENSLLLARDKMGIKPLVYYIDEDKLLFSSEMKSLLTYKIPKVLNKTALAYYFQLNYTPAPLTMIQGVNKLMPGQYLLVEGKRNNVIQEQYYEIPKPIEESADHRLDYEVAKNQLIEILEKSVADRLIADVPLGAFLSGGIDSSVITALASRHTDRLNTFSIGYQQDPFFDETSYANLVAKRFNTNHTVFSLSREELLYHVDEAVDYMDDPFADSSALPVYILSKKSRQHVTVALSGDGADEIFSGYNKHEAWQKSFDGKFTNQLVKWASPIWEIAPKSRSGKVGNTFRQLLKFSQMLSLSPKERYWFLATFQQSEKVRALLKEDYYQWNPELKEKYLESLNNGSLNQFLRIDSQLVLPNDMLAKVDLMSMANHLEVRVPFLDHRVVNFAFGQPENFKLVGKLRKRVLQDAFREILPGELYQRPKKGFEVPLLPWFRNEMKGKLNEQVFSRSLIQDQGIFQWEHIEQIQKKLLSSNPGDVHAQVWALFVFQRWYSKYFL